MWTREDISPLLVALNLNEQKCGDLLAVIVLVVVIHLPPSWHPSTSLLSCMDLRRTIAFDLNYVLGHVHELVDQSLSIHLGQDTSLVIVPQGTTHRLVVHVRLVLVQSPETRHGLRVDQLEDALVAVRPLDKSRAVFAVLQKFQQELPQVRCRSLATLPLHAHLDLRLFRLLQLLQVLVLLAERQVVVVVGSVMGVQVERLLVLGRPLVLLRVIRSTAQVLSRAIQLSPVVVALEAGQLQHVV